MELNRRDAMVSVSEPNDRMLNYKLNPNLFVREQKNACFVHLSMVDEFSCFIQIQINQQIRFHETFPIGSLLRFFLPLPLPISSIPIHFLALFVDILFYLNRAAPGVKLKL